MKKRILSALSSLPIIAALALSGTSSAAGCPYGQVNCAYPGLCGRYIDADGDGICDLSATAATTSDSSTSSDTSQSTDPSSTDVSDNNQIDSGSYDAQNSNADTNNVNATIDPGSDTNGGFFGDGNYHILPISLILISGYLLTYFLFKKGVLKRSKHKRLWNLLLTAGYLGTGGTGILLVLLINFSIKTALNPSLTYWHAELSILMIIGTLIHIHIYRNSFKNMFQVLFGSKNGNQTKKNRNLDICKSK